MSRSSIRCPPLRWLALAGLLLIEGCVITERPGPETSIEPAAEPPAEEMDRAPVPGRELAFDLIAMVDVRAARPAPRPDDFILDDEAAGGDDQIGQYGAAIIVGRADGHVYLTTAEHVAFPSHQPTTRVDVRFRSSPSAGSRRTRCQAATKRSTSRCCASPRRPNSRKPSTG